MSSHAQTPPHHPTYDVHLSKNQIVGIVRATFPEFKLEKPEELEHAKSFNNRIYFLSLVPLENDHGARLELVLKVCGHYFGERKVQNEVGSLLLLKQYCPSVPTPEVRAWSNQGMAIECVRGRNIEKLSTDAKSWQSDHGWILISRLQGRTIETSDLDGPHCSALLQQLARHVFTWRTALPEATCMGNISLALETSRPLPIDVQGKQLMIGGLILTNKYDPTAHSSWSRYYEYVLQDKYDHLVSAPELKPLAMRIAEPVSSFLSMVSRLPFLADDKIKSTHMDLSPRNILISQDESHGDSPPVITGIIDWEFAAFLPSPMKWLNSLINQSDDWPEEAYMEFLLHLAELQRQSGIAIDLPVLHSPGMACMEPSRCICPYHVFKHLATLEKAIEHVAPWWITPNAYVGRQPELEEDCDRAESVVLDCLQQLKRAFD